MIRRYWLLAVVLLVGVGATLLTVVTREAGDRWSALGLVVAGLVVGLPAGLVLARRRTSRTDTGGKSMAERINDGAFVAVVVVVWAMLLGLLGVWSGLVTGFLVGAALGLTGRAGGHRSDTPGPGASGSGAPGPGAPGRP